MSLPLRITTLFLVLLHPRNSPCVIALELKIFLLTFMQQHKYMGGFVCLFSPPSPHIQLFSVVNLPEDLRRPGCRRLWITGAYSKIFFMNITWVTCSTDVKLQRATLGWFHKLAITVGLCMKHLFFQLPFLAALPVRAFFQHWSKQIFHTFRISGTYLRCKQQEMKSVTATWKYRKRHKTFTCKKRSQGSLAIASYMKVTASSSFVDDSPVQLFCFLEQQLTSFDVCHLRDHFYISFLFSYVLTFVSWPHTVHMYCTVKQSSQTLKSNFCFFQFCVWEWKICMHCTLPEQPLNKIHQVAV